MKDFAGKVAFITGGGSGAAFGQAVDVLPGWDPGQQRVRVQMLRNRQLQQDAGHLRVGGELVEDGRELVLRDVPGKVPVQVADADLVRDDRDGGLSYLLHCERSSGQFLADMLLDAGAEFGIEVTGFESGRVTLA